MVKKCLYST